jgi:uncharacterized RmlC-like cupin family protein
VGGPSDFVLIPKGVVHREGNPSTEPNEAIVFRVGEDEVLVNVDGPDQPATATSGAPHQDRLKPPERSALRVFWQSQEVIC